MSDKYSASQIKVLEWHEHVRQSLGMYIVGSSKTKGLHNLVFEVIYYAIDDVLNGECDRIEVEINMEFKHILQKSIGIKNICIQKLFIFWKKAIA
jgi:DNA gyrase/topoisomerase IV subunit B